jgi:hypothetical protein
LSATRPGKGTLSGGRGGTRGGRTGTGGGGAGRDGTTSSSDTGDGDEVGRAGCSSTDFCPAEVTTGGGISSSLTTCPARALFIRSSSILIPRPNLKWNINHGWITRRKRGGERLNITGTMGKNNIFITYNESTPRVVSLRVKKLEGEADHLSLSNANY